MKMPFTRLVWQDEFDGADINRALWRFEEGHVRNNELQIYTDAPENAFLRDGCLVIRALRMGNPNCPYTSASLNTLGTQSVLYGRLEIRAKLPYGKGIWPAFWTLGANIEDVPWPACGEIDIMEMVGGPERNEATCPFGDHVGDHIVQGTIHYADEQRGLQRAIELTGGKRFCDDFHIFTLDWTESCIKIGVDGLVYASYDIRDLEAFHKPHYVLLNLALGGAWPGDPDESTVFPQEYVIDYIRYYQ